jgi:hypothetical protein
VRVSDLAMRDGVHGEDILGAIIGDRMAMQAFMGM